MCSHLFFYFKLKSRLHSTIIPKTNDDMDTQARIHMHAREKFYGEKWACRSNNPHELWNVVACMGWLVQIRFEAISSCKIHFHSHSLGAIFYENMWHCDLKFDISFQFSNYTVCIFLLCVILVSLGEHVQKTSNIFLQANQYIIFYENQRIPYYTILYIFYVINLWYICTYVQFSILNVNGIRMNTQINESKNDGKRKMMELEKEKRSANVIIYGRRNKYKRNLEQLEMILNNFIKWKYRANSHLFMKYNAIRCLIKT